MARWSSLQSSDPKSLFERISGREAANCGAPTRPTRCSWSSSDTANDDRSMDLRYQKEFFVAPEVMDLYNSTFRRWCRNRKIELEFLLA